jgi:hypothetical protein
MTEDQLRHIESSLGLTLPADYRRFLAQDPGEDILDDTTVMRHADSIIDSTLEYQNSFEGLPSWPQHWLYIGDEADACPYVLDCLSGELIRTDKGNLNRKPLAQYPSFQHFYQHREEESKKLPSPTTWKGSLLDQTPLLLAVFGFFIVLPFIGFSIKMIYLWLLNRE